MNGLSVRGASRQGGKCCQLRAPTARTTTTALHSSDSHSHSPLCSPRKTSLNFLKAAWAKSEATEVEEALGGAA